MLPWKAYVVPNAIIGQQFECGICGEQTIRKTYNQFKCSTCRFDDLCVSDQKFGVDELWIMRDSVALLHM